MEWRGKVEWRANEGKVEWRANEGKVEWRAKGGQSGSEYKKYKNN